MKYSSTIQYEVNKYLPVLMPTKFMPGYKWSELHCRKQAVNQQAQESVVRSTRIRTSGNLYLEYQGCRSGIQIHLSTHKYIRAGENTRIEYYAVYYQTVATTPTSTYSTSEVYNLYTARARGGR
jgi:hypothetical protein